MDADMRRLYRRQPFGRSDKLTTGKLKVDKLTAGKLKVDKLRMKKGE